MNVEIIKNKDVKSRFVELADEKTFIREASFAIQAIDKNPTLSKCDPNSIQLSVVNIAQIGLSLNPVNPTAYLVPRWDNKAKAYKCVLEPSYQGLVKLVTDTKSVISVYSHVVYKEDVFKIKLGTSYEIEHEPKFKSKEIEKVYAVGILPDGSKQIEVMDREDVYAIRDISESYKAYMAKKISTCVWITNESEMWRKSVIKRLCKYLPKTDRWELLNKAIEIDNSDYTLDIDSGKLQFLYNLIEQAKLDEKESEALRVELFSGITNERADQLIARLQSMVPNPIKSGHNYNQTDIKNQLT